MDNMPGFDSTGDNKREHWHKSLRKPYSQLIFPGGDPMLHKHSFHAPVSEVSPRMQFSSPGNNSSLYPIQAISFGEWINKENNPHFIPNVPQPHCNDEYGASGGRSRYERDVSPRSQAYSSPALTGSEQNQSKLQTFSDVKPASPPHDQLIEPNNDNSALQYPNYSTIDRMLKGTPLVLKISNDAIQTSAANPSELIRHEDTVYDKSRLEYNEYPPAIHTDNIPAGLFDSENGVLQTSSNHNDPTAQDNALPNNIAVANPSQRSQISNISDSIPDKTTINTSAEGLVDAATNSSESQIRYSADNGNINPGNQQAYSTRTLDDESVSTGNVTSASSLLRDPAILLVTLPATIPSHALVTPGYDLSTNTSYDTDFKRSNSSILSQSRAQNQYGSPISAIIAIAEPIAEGSQTQDIGTSTQGSQTQDLGTGTQYISHDANAALETASITEILTLPPIADSQQLHALTAVNYTAEDQIIPLDKVPDQTDLNQLVPINTISDQVIVVDQTGPDDIQSLVSSNNLSREIQLSSSVAWPLNSRKPLLVVMHLDALFEGKRFADLITGAATSAEDNPARFDLIEILSSPEMDSLSFSTGLEDVISFLTQRLANRGYEISAQATLKEICDIVNPNITFRESIAVLSQDINVVTISEDPKWQIELIPYLICAKFAPYNEIFDKVKKHFTGEEAKYIYGCRNPSLLDGVLKWVQLIESDEMADNVISKEELQNCIDRLSNTDSPCSHEDTKAMTKLAFSAFEDVHLPVMPEKVTIVSSNYMELGIKGLLENIFLHPVNTIHAAPGVNIWLDIST